MTDLADRMLDALSLAGAEWELRCHHHLHAVPEPILLVRDDQVPPIIPCPGCSAARPLRIVQLRRV